MKAAQKLVLKFKKLKLKIFKSNGLQIGSNNWNYSPEGSK